MDAGGSAEGRLASATAWLEAACSCATPEQMATEARGIVAAWWLDVQAGGTPWEHLAWLAGELRHRCLAEVAERMRRAELSERGGDAEGAGRQRLQAAALQGAAGELSFYE